MLRAQPDKAPNCVRNRYNIAIESQQDDTRLKRQCIFFVISHARCLIFPRPFADRSFPRVSDNNIQKFSRRSRDEIEFRFLVTLEQVQVFLSSRKFIY